MKTNNVIQHKKIKPKDYLNNHIDKILKKGNQSPSIHNKGNNIMSIFESLDKQIPSISQTQTQTKHNSVMTEVKDISIRMRNNKNVNKKPFPSLNMNMNSIFNLNSIQTTDSIANKESSLVKSKNKYSTITNSKANIGIGIGIGTNPKGKQVIVGHKTSISDNYNLQLNDKIINSIGKKPMFLNSILKTNLKTQISKGLSQNLNSFSRKSSIKKSFKQVKLKQPTANFDNDYDRVNNIIKYLEEEKLISLRNITNINKVFPSPNKHFPLPTKKISNDINDKNRHLNIGSINSNLNSKTNNLQLNLYSVEDNLSNKENKRVKDTNKTNLNFINQDKGFGSDRQFKFKTIQADTYSIKNKTSNKEEFENDLNDILPFNKDSYRKNKEVKDKDKSVKDIFRKNYKIVLNNNLILNQSTHSIKNNINSSSKTKINNNNNQISINENKSISNKSNNSLLFESRSQSPIIRNAKNNLVHLIFNNRKTGESNINLIRSGLQNHKIKLKNYDKQMSIHKTQIRSRLHLNNKEFKRKLSDSICDVSSIDSLIDYNENLNKIKKIVKDSSIVKIKNGENILEVYKRNNNYKFKGLDKDLLLKKSLDYYKILTEECLLNEYDHKPKRNIFKNFLTKIYDSLEDFKVDLKKEDIKDFLLKQKINCPINMNNNIIKKYLNVHINRLKKFKTIRRRFSIMHNTLFNNFSRNKQGNQNEEEKEEKEDEVTNRPLRFFNDDNGNEIKGEQIKIFSQINKSNIINNRLIVKEIEELKGIESTEKEGTQIFIRQETHINKPNNITNVNNQINNSKTNKNEKYNSDEENHILKKKGRYSKKKTVYMINKLTKKAISLIKFKENEDSILSHFPKSFFNINNKMNIFKIYKKLILNKKLNRNRNKRGTKIYTHHKNMNKYHSMSKTKDLMNLVTSSLNDFDKLIQFIRDNDLIKFKEYFLKNRVIGDKKDENGNSLLNFAIICGSNSISKFLIDEGANVNSQNNKLNTPLHNALLNKNYILVDYLRMKKANELKLNINGLNPWQNMTIHS